MQVASEDIQAYELDLLTGVLRDRFGYDFRHYAHDSLLRRTLSAVDHFGVQSMSELIPRVIHEPRFCHRLVGQLTVQVTEMFRDAKLFRCLREHIIARLQTWPYIKIWVAGCSTGEEVYSLAILLYEEGLLDRTRIFATDINREALSIAEEGIYRLDDIEKYAANYRLAGGAGHFSNYYDTRYKLARMDSTLRENIVFSHHNLAVDGVFSETQLLLCCNVLIYFDRTLQNRVLRLFNESLSTSGILCLGNRETLQFTELESSLAAIDQVARVYQKLPQSEIIA
ncbi:MAG: CheR family methyltransferase [Pseudomonadota bacterium]